MEAIRDGDLSRPALGEAMVRGGPGVGIHLLLLRSSDASEGGGEAFAGTGCYQPTPLSPPEEMPNATDVTISGHRRRGFKRRATRCSPPDQD